MKRHQLVDRLRASFPGEDNHGFNAFDLLHKFGRPLSALLYTELFWPEFREFEGMVFLADSVEDVGDEARVREALDTYRDRTQVEKSFNFVEVPSLFGRSAGETSDEEDELLASRLRDKAGIIRIRH